MRIQKIQWCKISRDRHIGSRHDKVILAFWILHPYGLSLIILIHIRNGRVRGYISRVPDQLEENPFAGHGLSYTDINRTAFFRHTHRGDVKAIIKFGSDRYVGCRHGKGVSIASGWRSCNHLISRQVRYNEVCQSIIGFGGCRNAKFHLFTISLHDSLRCIDSIQPDGTTIYGRPTGCHGILSKRVAGTDGHIITRHREAIGTVTIINDIHQCAIAVINLYLTKSIDTGIAVGHSKGYRFSSYRARGSSNHTSALRSDTRRDVVNMRSGNGILGSALGGNETKLNITSDNGGFALTGNHDVVVVVLAIVIPFILAHVVGPDSEVLRILSHAIGCSNGPYKGLDVTAERHCCTCLDSATGRVKVDMNRSLGDAHQGLILVDRDAVNASRYLEGTIIMLTVTIQGDIR